MHLTLGILRQSQAVSYALAFFQLDGFAVPAPAQVTQTVRRLCVEGLLSKTHYDSTEIYEKTFQDVARSSLEFRL